MLPTTAQRLRRFSLDSFSSPPNSNTNHSALLPAFEPLEPPSNSTSPGMHSEQSHGLPQLSGGTGFGAGDDGDEGNTSHSAPPEPEWNSLGTLITSVLFYLWTTFQKLPTRLGELYRRTIATCHKPGVHVDSESISKPSLKTKTLVSACRPFFITFTAPHICSASPYDYDSNGFWDFPSRSGWALDATGYRNYQGWEHDLASLDVMYSCRQYEVPGELSSTRPLDSLKVKCYRTDGNRCRYAPLSEQVAFLQAWLFFGMLAEISSICSLEINLQDEFVVNAPDGAREISTAALNGLPQRWLDAAVKDQTKTQKLDPDRMRQITRVIQHVMSMQRRYEDRRGKELQKLTYGEYKVLLSIRVVTRTVLLTLALSGACEIALIRTLMDPQIHETFPAWWDELKEFAKDELLQEGWCKSEIKLLEPKALENEPPDQVNEEIYHTVHTEPECRCAQAVVDQEDLRAVLEKGLIPRIEVSDDYRVFVTEDCPYIAISHVWSHGLGNPVENALPLCQIRRPSQDIAKVALANELHGRVALWIDTLCIPVAKTLREYRNQAIVQLGHTYKGAEAVLVLDRELEQVDTEKTSLLEQELLMSFVGWMRRLWTLQEAAQARNLFIQTLQGPYPVTVHHDLSGSGVGGTEEAISQLCFREGIEELIRNRIPALPTMQTTSFQTSRPNAGFPVISELSTSYQRLCFAVKHRSTSKMTDEAIILSTIIGADTREFLNLQDVDARMSIFHTLMREIPSDIIFANVEKVRKAPFRWAPRSLLNFGMFRVSSFGPPGICDSQGLHATYHGLVLDGCSGQEAEEGRYYAEDKHTGMKYTYVIRGNPFPLPEKSGFIMRYNGINGDVAAVNILQVIPEDINADMELGDRNTSQIADGGANIIVASSRREVYEVTIVGYLTLVASGGSWDIDGEPSRKLQGMMTSAEQRWLIT